ncbi:hypothetical protein SNOG_10220 [Parastagonospora nodorum SN15]|uniref:Uncharacterized protein n=1 Tax=Phaeosphaeria nodorum (strain SN15 / ATCC MYA-4574 / FGSC 10173) TaxID=321614 RepID=Q0UDE4_PHANO|nr:hypothetical protein SNOG_10220 [Parastagonospora nodorum SN15]EAT82555.1 hypothetical protein SNOG_10220 [Parastagonospora nodorum SN15]
MAIRPFSLLPSQGALPGRSARVALKPALSANFATCTEMRSHIRTRPPALFTVNNESCLNVRIRESVRQDPNCTAEFIVPRLQVK